MARRMFVVRFRAAACALALAASGARAQSDAPPPAFSPPLAPVPMSDPPRLPPAVYAPGSEGGLVSRPQAKPAPGTHPTAWGVPLAACVLAMPPPGLSRDEVLWWGCKASPCTLCPDGLPWGRGR